MFLQFPKTWSCLQLCNWSKNICCYLFDTRIVIWVGNCLFRLRIRPWCSRKPKQACAHPWSRWLIQLWSLDLSLGPSAVVPGIFSVFVSYLDERCLIVFFFLFVIWVPLFSGIYTYLCSVCAPVGFFYGHFLVVHVYINIFNTYLHMYVDTSLSFIVKLSGAFTKQ